MTFVIAALMIVGLAAAIAYPLWAGTERTATSDAGANRDVLEREKEVALLAIREAELDEAMGKLSAEDYATLRHQYEKRALAALGALDAMGEPATDAVSRPSSKPNNDAARDRFCSACGRRYRSAERFCAGCGRARA